MQAKGDQIDTNKHEIITSDECHSLQFQKPKSHQEPVLQILPFHNIIIETLLRIFICQVALNTMVLLESRFLDSKIKKKWFQNENTSFLLVFLRPYIGCFLETYILCIELPKACR